MLLKYFWRCLINSIVAWPQWKKGTVLIAAVWATRAWRARIQVWGKRTILRWTISLEGSKGENHREFLDFKEHKGICLTDTSPYFLHYSRLNSANCVLYTFSSLFSLSPIFATVVQHGSFFSVSFYTDKDIFIWGRKLENSGLSTPIPTYPIVRAATGQAETLHVFHKPRGTVYILIAWTTLSHVLQVTSDKHHLRIKRYFVYL